MNTYTLDNCQPIRNNLPIKISTLIDDINKLNSELKKQIELNATLHKSNAKHRQTIKQLLHEMDNGIND